MTQSDGDGLPTMGEQAEATLQNETGFRCTCGQPDKPGVMHRTDKPCYIPARLNKGQEPMPAEKWASHVDCDVAKRDHKWEWKWDIQGMWTDEATCVHCGKTVIMKRPAQGRGVTPDDQTRKARGS